MSTTTLPHITQFDRMVIYIERFAVSYSTLCSRVLLRPFDKIKPFNLDHHSACRYHTRQVGDLLWGAPIGIVSRLFNYVILRDHMTNQKHFISSTTITMFNKLGRMVIYREEPPLIKLWSFSHVFFLRSRDNLNIIYNHLH